MSLYYRQSCLTIVIRVGVPSQRCLQLCDVGGALIQQLTEPYDLGFKCDHSEVVFVASHPTRSVPLANLFAARRCSAAYDPPTTLSMNLAIRTA